MRVEPGDRDPGPGDTERPAGVMGNLDDILDSLRCDARDRLFQGNMGADVDDAQVRADQEHADPLRTGPLGQQLGVAGVVVAGQMHGGLVERRGDDRVDLPCHGQVAGTENVGDGGRSGGGGLLSNRDAVGGRVLHVEQRHASRSICPVGGVLDQVELRGLPQPGRGALQDAPVPDDKRPAAPEDVRVGECLQHDLGTDPGRIAHGDRQDGPDNLRHLTSNTGLDHQTVVLNIMTNTRASLPAKGREAVASESGGWRRRFALDREDSVLELAFDLLDILRE